MRFVRRKSVLHPDQLVAVNELFDVSEQEVECAERALSELDAAEGRGDPSQHWMDSWSRIRNGQLQSEFCGGPL